VFNPGISDTLALAVFPGSSHGIVSFTSFSGSRRGGFLELFAINPTTGTTAALAEQTVFSGTGSLDNKVTALSRNTFVVAYREPTGTSYMQPGSFSASSTSGTITMGTRRVRASGEGLAFRLADHRYFTLIRSGPSLSLKVCECTPDGLSETCGVPQEMATDYNSGLCYDTMSATTIMVLYTSTSGLSKAVVVELELFGTNAATIHSDLPINGPYMDSDYYGSCVALSPNVMVFGGQYRCVHAPHPARMPMRDIRVQKGVSPRLHLALAGSSGPPSRTLPILRGP